MKQILIATSIFALAACGSEGEQSSAPTEAPATEAPTNKEANALVEKAKQAAAEAVEALKLDASSLDAFKSSLGNMKASLTGDQANQLSGALASLAKGATEKKGGLMDAAKGMASGKSLEETLYEKLGDQLNGLTFEEILAKAN